MLQLQFTSDNCMFPAPTDVLSNSFKLVYRVAQNKMPHQTICNIFATSGQILKILGAFNPDTSLNPMVYNVSTSP